jgi:uncharacterized RDD family membrane protein YckC
MIQTQYAPFSRRLVAYLVDHLILGVITGPLLIPPLSFFPRLIFDNSLFGFLSFGFGSVFMVVSWFYFTLFESSPRQATPGKMLMGIFVTDELGARLTIPMALVRTLTKIISGLFCFLGYIMALFTARSQALHDMLASSLVLRPDLSSRAQYYAPGAPDISSDTGSASQAAPSNEYNDKNDGTIQL